MSQGPPARTRPVRLVLAWCVHLYTALGLACAAGMAVLLFHGDDDSFRRAFWLMLLATFIDATDGARPRQAGAELLRRLRARRS